MSPRPTDEAQREVDVRGVLARCQACRKAHEPEAYELDGVVWELHLPIRCKRCGEPNELITVVPVTVSMSHDGDEWYVIPLDEEALTRMRLRRDPWPADEESN